MIDEEFVNLGLLQLFDCLFCVPCNIDTSKLFERKFLRRARFSSEVISLDNLDSSRPHLSISVADDVNEFKIDIRSVLEQTIPAAC